MIHQGDIGLELYVATDKFPDPKQYRDSQIVLGIVSSNRLQERLDVIPVDNLNQECSGNFDDIAEFLNLIKIDPNTKLRLPYLVRFVGCETSHYFGYSGLEEVKEELDSM